MTLQIRSLPLRRASSLTLHCEGFEMFFGTRDVETPSGLLSTFIWCLHLKEECLYDRSLTHLADFYLVVMDMSLLNK